MLSQKILRFLTISLAVVLVGLVCARFLLRRHHSSSSLPQTQYGSVGNFSLTDQRGNTVSLENLKGNTWVADFVFTRCMGPCPLLTTNMARLESEFKDKTNLKFVSFSVDPEHDTPKVLATYAKNYGITSDNWYFLTGKKETIFKLIRESFNLAVERGAETPQAIDILHSLYFVLVGPDGRIQRYYNTTDENALRELRTALSRL